MIGKDQEQQQQQQQGRIPLQPPAASSSVPASTLATAPDHSRSFMPGTASHPHFQPDQSSTTIMHHSTSVPFHSIAVPQGDPVFQYQQQQYQQPQHQQYPQQMNTLSLLSPQIQQQLQQFQQQQLQQQQLQMQQLQMQPSQQQFQLQLPFGNTVAGTNLAGQPQHHIDVSFAAQAAAAVGLFGSMGIPMGACGGLSSPGQTHQQQQPTSAISNPPSFMAGGPSSASLASGSFVFLPATSMTIAAPTAVAGFFVPSHPLQQQQLELQSSSKPPPPPMGRLDHQGSAITPIPSTTAATTLTAGGAAPAAASSYGIGTVRIISGTGYRHITPFPWRLHEMLQALEEQSMMAIASWLPNGRAFKVHNARLLADDVIPTYFKHNQYKSFQRQLHIYGFQRFDEGPLKGAYHHQFFLRENRALCQMIRRTSGTPKTPQGQGQVSSTGSNSSTSSVINRNEPPLLPTPVTGSTVASIPSYPSSPMTTTDEAVPTTRQEPQEKEDHDLQANDNNNEEEKHCTAKDKATRTKKNRAPSLQKSGTLTMPQSVENSDPSGESSTMPFVVAASAASLDTLGALLPQPVQGGGILLKHPSTVLMSPPTSSSSQAVAATIPATQQNNEALVLHNDEQYSMMDHRIALSSSSSSSLNPATMERLGNRTGVLATMQSTMLPNLFPHSLQDDPPPDQQQPTHIVRKAPALGAVKGSDVEAGNTTTSKPKPQEQQAPEEGVEQFANEIIYLFAESLSSGSDAATAGVPIASGEDGGDRGRGGDGCHVNGAGTTTAAAGDAGRGTGTNSSPSTDESHYSWDNIFGL